MCDRSLLSDKAVQGLTSQSQLSVQCSGCGLQPLGLSLTQQQQKAKGGLGLEMEGDRGLEAEDPLWRLSQLHATERH